MIPDPAGLRAILRQPADQGAVVACTRVRRRCGRIAVALTARNAMRLSRNFQKRIQILQRRYRLLPSRSPAPHSVANIYSETYIREFEVLRDQCGNLLRKRLRPWFASYRQADRLTFKDVFRHASKHGLIFPKVCERWLRYQDIRNDAVYFREAASQKLLRDFVADVRALAARSNPPNITDDDLRSGIGGVGTGRTAPDTETPWLACRLAKEARARRGRMGLRRPRHRAKPRR